ncbi:MAG TPA: DNA cytosine methyltransferase [Cellvibrionaceae bacterium]|nr:DNA cytosine methyltransferase [Cellvibrionaceae bacterium]
MRFGSVCSGIEAASVAWEPLGWRAAWLSEIEKFPSELLAQRYPGVKNLGDMRFIAEKIRRGSIEAPEIIVGGTPCQAFSVAGLRNSLDDSRGQLTLKFVELVNAVDEARAAIRLGASVIVWENVPGVLSAKHNAFGCFLAGLAGEDEPLEPPGEKWTDAGCVFGPQRAVAWRCLDAQYFGLAQRRKRVFVIASARAGFDPTKVLFEFDGVRRDSAPSREAAEVVAATIDASAGRRALMARMGRGFNGQEAAEGQLIVVHGTQDPCVSNSAAFTLGTNRGQENAVFAVRTAQTGSNGWGVNPDTAYTLDCANGQAVCFAENSRAEVRLEGGDGQIVGALSTGGGKPGQGMPTIAGSSGVRRLLPVECEFLQGFPRDYTAITIKGKPAADGPRYRALGNSMAVPCMHFIGKRISQYLNNKGEN